MLPLVAPEIADKALDSMQAEVDARFATLEAEQAANGQAAPSTILVDDDGPTDDDDDDETFAPAPVDWGVIRASGVRTLEYLDEPYLPARKRIWAVGPAESGKSVWAAWKTQR